MAKCCFQLHKYTEALNTLLPNAHSIESINKLYTRQEFVQQYGEISSFVAQLLGSVYAKLDQSKFAIHYYSMSLEINPFLWSSFEQLVQLEPSIDVNKLINTENCDFTYSCGTNKLVTMNTLKSSSINKFEVITPETDMNWQTVNCLAPSKNTPNKASRKIGPSVALKLLNNDGSVNNKNISNDGTVNRNLLAYMESMDTSSRHAFGVLQLDKEFIFDDSNIKDNKDSNTTNNRANTTPITKKPQTRRNTQQELQGK